MAKVSLIGMDLAKEGIEFTFVQPLKECSPCGVKNVCFNLEPGRSYRIGAVREREHPCSVYEGDKVRAIEVEELEFTANLEYSQKLQEGSKITLKSMECGIFTCSNIEECNLMHRRQGVKATISELAEKLDCPKGLDIRKVRLK
ncbi:MAG: UPF0179 family protein [Candidatus Thermoplasmatota archaeon]|jgi:uncharacterized protein (UPF0179 family)|nr:UPF0179 family protein [Candidatus Thermoplasmatota archaeon]MCL5785419.1 UPF0179 family protein [Candidatus Thermoplasmatota archaeon]